MIMTPAMLNFYREHGYCHVPGLLDPSTVAAILQEVDALVALQMRRVGLDAVPYADEATLLTNMERLLAADLQAYLAAIRHAAKLISLQRIASHDAVSHLACALGMTAPSMPTSPVLHVMGDTLKIPGGYYGIAPHQDWPSIQGGLDTITVWTPLMDVDADRFPVEFLPSSHLKGLWAGEVNSNALEITHGFSEDDWVRVPAARGDAVVFSGFTVHRTALVGCRGLRIASSNRYENSAEPTFVERGYPCAYKRSVERDFIVKGFPAPRQVAELFQA